ncbi:hypothetical protein ECZU34_00040 [Escherichia coli]|nr:hypothetical protein ECZU34_00040 [Escherichia coli]
MAERLLSYNFYPVGKVAKICGYESASYFISVFRRYFGVPRIFIKIFLEKARCNVMRFDDFVIFIFDDYMMLSATPE